MNNGKLRVDEQLISSCGKLMLLDRMLTLLKRDGHKVLIFSQMTQMMDILEDYCGLRGHSYCRLDGSMKMTDRQDEINRFSDDDVFLFLLSTRAGGLGINLTQADTVVIYDSDWNPQCDLQAQDRCHRIGQSRPVIVYRLVTANTVDQKIVDRATAKRKLEKLVIHKGKFKSSEDSFKSNQMPISPQELLALLKESDYQEAMKDRATDSVISDTDLHQLLDRTDMTNKWIMQLEGKEPAIETKLKDVEGVFQVVTEVWDNSVITSVGTADIPDTSHDSSTTRETTATNSAV
jgi:ATP-dependent DNA helicase